MNDRNHEHYRDPTASEAVKNVFEVDEKASLVVKIIKLILKVSGFKLINRIEIQHKGSGRIYR